MQKLKTTLVASTLGTCLMLTAIPGYAAQPEFQAFLFQACTSATGDLSTRCTDANNGVDDGDLSGDSEDSLTPTQSLSNSTNALAQTRARIKALLEKSRATPGDEKTAVLDEATGTRAITQAFQQEGLSILAQAEYGDLERDSTLLERGYETESYLFKLGADYRVTDTFMIGALLGLDNYDQTFNPDLPGTNFVPQANEGDSDVSNLSISVFSTKNFSDIGYIEAQASYIYSDYEFSRSVVYQEFTRTLPLVDVNTSADTNGHQWALSLGGGIENSNGPWNYGLYGRADYQHVVIDSYQESGGNGLAMRFEEDTSTEITGTIGARLSRAINQDFGVLVPQIFVEHVHAFKSDARTTISSYIQDTANTRFTVTGDDPDENYLNVGISLMAVLPNGINAFVGYSSQHSNDYIDYYRINAGLRVEL